MDLNEYNILNVPIELQAIFRHKYQLYTFQMGLIWDINDSLLAFVVISHI